ncbi:5-hydroxyisourate hydrolase [wastewater metagenome]|uniref:hydroxyisourate hydrolase n=2 Tax=unclassified sequences TaxID=12908 RepID=A0A5B8R834_9ZZZZ|nr:MULTISPECIES: hydroxyisourate hydrolase [Arhodomonas]MCS4503935.1 hydroxyisourate hydrolase [Arhodomonas aquaeolei]QEA04850.1 5-hydroxyisourate hydrolase [uncultured organism]
MGRLTTHILDTAHGRPGSGIRIALARVEDNVLTPLTDAVSNDDGRVDGPLLEGDAFRAGQYQLVFQVGEYFDRLGLPGDAPRFLDEVVVRFGIAHADEHYHVPLLISPYSYTTYRGS